MLDKFRKFTKTPIGKLVIAVPAMGILAGFAMSDIQQFGSGGLGLSMGANTLAEVGSEKIEEREVAAAMQRRLETLRQTKPDATYADLVGEFDGILESVINQRVLISFAEKSNFVISKRLVDAELTQLPGTQGLNGKFSDASYRAFLAQRRMTDAEVRDLMKGGLVQRLLLTPVAGSARASVGMATPYANSLLEAREGEGAVLPLEAFTAGLKPTDADLQRFFTAQGGRYTVPEQRTLRIARVDPAAVASVTPSDAEIAKYYKDNAAQYAVSDTRDISQVVVQDKAVADGIAKRARAGGTLAAAAAAAKGAAVTTLKAQSRAAYADVAGDPAAGQVFGAADGAIVGPVKTDFGWAVVRVDSVTKKGGKTLEQARGEISAKLLADKRRQALEDIADAVQSAIDDGATFEEAVAAGKLTASTTPLITRAGTSLVQPGYRVDQADAPILKSGFDIPAGDPPELVALADNAYALVAPGEIVAAAPPPLAKIRDRVAADWVKAEALKRAKAAAEAAAAKASKGMSLSDALRQAGAALPPARPLAARRIQLMSAQGQVPPALQTLFSIAPGKAKAVPDKEGRGYGVVKLNKITPGNAMVQPGLIVQVQNDLQQAMSDTYAQEFVAAAAKELKVKRNEKAIKAYRERLAAGNN
jgi:peptidyl-prolyl cis-trans isomerase D